MDSREAEEVMAYYVNWFSGYKWRWFGSLEVSDRSREGAIAMFDEWITRIGKEEGSSHFRWVRVLEPIGKEHFRFNVLVGGFRDRKSHWSHQWKRLGGKTRIRTYDPGRDPIPDMLKNLKSKGEIDIDFKLRRRAD